MTPRAATDATPLADSEDREVRFRLTLHYDGGGYHGWQLQPHVPTVQGAVEDVIERLVGHRRPVIASGRTDRGVHATGQVVSVQLPDRWDASRLRAALNGLLPRDIWVAQATLDAPDFHPRYDALDRTYRYDVGTGPNARSPFRRRWWWALGQQPDVQVLAAASERLIGDHSFEAFAKAGQPERGDRCIVHAAEWSAIPEGVRWTVTANRYLHHMVRYLVGTMVDIGLGRRDPDDLSALLDGRADLVTSPPAPPEGLYLHRVRYPGDPDVDPAEAVDSTRSPHHPSTVSE